MSYRQGHFLKHNKTNEGPSELIFVDTETDEVKVDKDIVEHHLRFGWACYVRRLKDGKWSAPKWCRFGTKQEFYDFVTSHLRPKTRLYIFAHNANFDYRVLNMFEWLASTGGKLNKAVLKDTPFIFQFRWGKATLVLLDTMNIWKMSLEKLGKIVGCQKYCMPKLGASRKLWDQYCKRDVEIIKTAVTSWLDFLKREDLGGFAPTLAGQSMRLFRHRFMKHKIVIHKREEVQRLERACYHGGRNECFRIGRIEDDLYWLDVNSMYPSVMKDNEYPTKLVGYIERCKIEALESFHRNYLVCARVLIETDENVYPYHRDGKLMFPLGRFETCICTPEIRYALQRRHIVDIRELAIYEHAQLFTEFVNYLYSKRLAAETSSDPTDAQSYKILLNAHYGKWGQHGYRRRHLAELPTPEWRIEDVFDGVTREWVQYQYLGHDLSVVERTLVGRDSFVAIAAHVTAYARMYLWRLMLCAGVDQVLYCDTDSLLVTKIGYERLSPFIDSTALGMLKLEKRLPWIEIRGCKDYSYEKGGKTKGVKKNAVWVNENVVVQDQWEGLPGMLRSGEVRPPRIKKIVKHLERKYDKGIVTPDGDVVPFCLSQ